MTARPAHRAAQGVHGVGSPEYSPEEYALVVAVFLQQDDAVTVAQLHEKTGVSGLAVRQIMAAADGVAFVLGGSGADGYRRATTYDEYQRLTDRFTSQIDKMSARAVRRHAFALKAFFGGT